MAHSSSQTQGRDIDRPAGTDHPDQHTLPYDEGGLRVEYSLARGARDGDELAWRILRWGRAERHGFEYVRRGTLSLYAAHNTKTGQVTKPATWNWPTI